MNDTLEDRLRRHYGERTSELPANGPGVGTGVVLTVRRGPTQPRRSRAARTTLAIGSAAAVAITGLVLVNRPAAEAPPPSPSSPNSASSTPSEETDPVAPAFTLPGSTVATSLPPPAESAAWRTMSPSPLEGRRSPASVWTGTEMIVVGGNRDDEAAPGEDAQAATSDGRRLKVTVFPDGAAYDPATDTWRTIAPMPADFVSGDATWTGTEMLVLGGITSIDPEAPLDALVLAYDPVADSWHSWDAPSGVADSTGTTTVWTGAELVVWGHPFRQEQATTAAFDPATGQWRELPPGPLTGLFWPAAVWTGDEVVVVVAGTGATSLPSGVPAAALDPVTGRWRELPPAPLGYPYEAVTLFWNGTDVVLAGGSSPDGGSRQVVLYDQLANEWSVGGMLPGDGRMQAGYVWTGTNVIEVGGYPIDGAASTPGDGPVERGVVALDPLTGDVTLLADLLVPTADAALVWTGQDVLVWGGLPDLEGIGTASADGAVLSVPALAGPA